MYMDFVFIFIAFLIICFIVAGASVGIYHLLSKHRSVKEIDGYLDVVYPPEGDPAILLEVNDLNDVVEKTVVVLKVRKAERMHFGSEFAK